jgi:hypothetical protein
MVGDGFEPVKWTIELSPESDAAKIEHRRFSAPLGVR